MAYAMIVSCNGVKLAHVRRRRWSESRNAFGFTGNVMAAHWSKPDWNSLYKTSRFIEDSAIVAIWAHPPGAEVIRRAAESAAKKARA